MQKKSIHAWVVIVDTFINNICQRELIRDSKSKIAAKVAVDSVIWIHATQLERELSAAQVQEIREVLSIAPPDYALYNKVIGAWMAAVRQLTPSCHAVHPVTCQYHFLKLHYIPRTALPPAHHATLDNFCNRTAAQEMEVAEEFEVVPLTAEEWAAAWAAMSTSERIRYAQFVSVVLQADLSRYPVTWSVCMVASTCKVAVVLPEWVESRSRSFQDSCGISLRPDCFNEEVLRTIYAQCISGMNIDSTKLFNYLVVVYLRSNTYLLKPLAWMIEQFALSGCAAIVIIAEAMVTFNVRFEMLAATGGNPAEFSAFANGGSAPVPGSSLCHDKFTDYPSRLRYAGFERGLFSKRDDGRL